MLVLVTFGTLAEVTAQQTQNALRALVYPVPAGEKVTIQRGWRQFDCILIPLNRVLSATISLSDFPRAPFFDTKPCASMRLGTRNWAREPLWCGYCSNRYCTCPPAWRPRK